MKNTINVKHSFNSGDLITILAGLKQLSITKNAKINIYQQINFPAYYFDNQINAVVDKNGHSVCMNEFMFESLKPLILAQDYVNSFEKFNGENIDYDFDVTRDSRFIPMPTGTLHSWYQVLFHEMTSDLSKAWIEVPDLDNNDLSETILINRTQRYINPYINYFFLRQYKDRIKFIGTEDEYNHFCSTWNIQVERLKYSNFLELAQAIKKCKLFIGNQSMAFHLADAMKSNRVLELCPQFPNTFVYGENGKQFYHQSVFESIVNESIK